jgi:hypothetical protein
MTYFFLFDHVISQDRPHPNIAQHQALPYTPEWRQFSQRWPFSEPVGFYEHCRNHGVDVRAVELQDLAQNSAIYPIAVSFFDHSVDHLSRIPDTVKNLVRQKQVIVVIFYSEGDNPQVISDILREQEKRNDLPKFSTCLVSANSAADNLYRCVYFADDEFLFRHRNRWHIPSPAHLEQRPYDFTCLNRTHKWWRLTTMSELHRRGYLDRAQWSYNCDIECGDRAEDNPISIDYYPGLSDHMLDFFRYGPYQADGLDSDTHNDHEHHVPEHFSNSYFQVILETHFDADGSGGTFITEKTFKAIKNAQPFVIFGPPGTLHQLREMGYRVFDDVIDNSYDQIEINNDRWESVLDCLNDILAQEDLLRWYERCLPDIIHNQEIFMGDLTPRLNRTLERIFKHADH